MSARIVYEGMGGGGNLFEGTTFHVHQRVPQRNLILQNITANGGAIHPLEKGADIIIADCVRKDCPPGSISWKYIQDSVQKGELQNTEDYPASKLPRAANGTGAQAAASPSKSRPAQLKKMGRVPFTHEDDKALIDFCARKEKAGVQMGGNVIYKEFEQINPRHTYQSWRDRWLKHLQTRPRPVLDDEEEEEEEDEDEELPAPSQPTPKSKPLPKASKLAPKSTPKPSNEDSAKPSPKVSVAKPTLQRPKAGGPKTSLRASTATPVEARNVSSKRGSEFRPYIEASKGGKCFTDDETELLYANHDAIMNIDEEQVIDAWIAWSVLYPNHTPQEWRNHFNGEVRGKKPTSKKSKRKPTPVSSPVTSPRSVRKPDKGKGRAVADNPAPISSTREVNDSQGFSNNTLQSAASIQSSEDSVGTEEASFNDNFSKMAEVIFPERFEEGIDFKPDVCGVPLSLFEIWAGAFALGGPAELSAHNRWPELAKKLDFVEDERKRAGKELKAICCDLLLQFEKSLNDTRDISDSQAELEIDDQLRAEANEAARRAHPFENGEEEVEVEEESDEESDEGDDGDDDLNAPQSTKLVKTGMKRISPDTTTPANKRQKLDKGKGRARVISEIPSTPEDIINSHKRKSPFKPSPLKQAPLQPDEDLDDEEPSPLMSQRSPSPVKQVPKPRISDPYTQDFHFQDSLPRGAEREEEREEEEEDQDQQPIISPSPLRSKKLPFHSTNRSDPSSTNATRNSGPSQTGSSTQSQTDSQRKESREEFADKCTAFGYNPQDIRKALHATTHTLGPISMHVMQSLTEGKGIPKNEPGVWTSHDDEVLNLFRENPDSKRAKVKMMKMISKHTKDRIRARQQYLRDKRAD